MKIVKPINRVQDHHVTPINKKKYENEKRKTFHEILRPILKIVQFFGILPVSGINESQPNKLKFSLFSWRCLQSIVYVIGMCMLGFADSLELMEQADHIFSICNTMLQIGSCISESKIQAYFEIRFIHVFNRTSFEYWKAILCQLLNITATFVWSFIDAFLIIISMALTELFERVTNKIKIFYLQEVDESIWSNIREDFNKVTILCRLVNKTMSDLILLSFTSNLYSICAQILHSISPMKNLSAIYFFYSMIFLLLRTLYLTLTLSKVHEASRDPLQYLFQVPKQSYCQEVGRFVTQITSEVIALTGMNFFSVRKGMILSVAGTILTYELVLIQFHETDPVVAIGTPKNISNQIKNKMKLVKPYNGIQDTSTARMDTGALKKNVKNPQTLHEIIKPLLTMAQCFGILPVMGIRSPTPNDLKFSFRSWRFFQSILFLIAMCSLASGNFYQLHADGLNFYRSTYYWPKLMQEWAIIESQMSIYSPSFNLHRRLYITAVVILVCATIENSLATYSSVVSARLCVSRGTALQAYFEVRFMPVFNRIAFAYWRGFLCQVINIIATFAWSFIDVFIIMISMALTELFQRIVNKIKSVHLQATEESTWRNIRENFNKVSALCRLTNDTVSDIILLSFTSNLCFICAQILHSINPMKHAADAVYFFFSMSFLVTRTLFLTLIASKVYEASRSPLPLLFNVPGYSYCLEIGRFIQQITSEIIALTGMNFFSVRKEMVLSVAGTIITYELVLIQFNAQTEDLDLPAPKNVTHALILPNCSKYPGN
ncbi:gustatory receptor 5a for trehalose-like [Chrysoperla carnea]|uniref:gustatory receptor 5a for trehalose-like n=1 Tax=Chrysoperla carnea TaxID=189513 RepID=UPI001D07137C|nr:gustatory receptor 5a for trehalose-like [Chrysoperla carnea]